MMITEFTLDTNPLRPRKSFASGQETEKPDKDVDDLLLALANFLRYFRPLCSTTLKKVTKSFPMILITTNTCDSGAIWEKSLPYLFDYN